MDQAVRSLWWVPVVRGVSAIAFGILTLVWPGASVYTIAVLFASLIAVYGIMDIVSGAQNLTKSPAGILKLLLGLLEVGVVVYLFRNAGSGITLATMGILMAVVLIAIAFVLVGSAFVSNTPTGYRWLMGITGLIILYIGITAARAPVISISTLIYALGIFGLFVGPLEIAGGIMLKNSDDTDR